MQNSKSNAMRLPRALQVLAGLAIAWLALSVGPAEAGSAPKTGAPRTETAVFAGGCFWCTESDFEHTTGVISAVSGYTGGPEANPTYEQVSSETTGHMEAVRVTFDPAKISYRALVDHFWRTIDPTDQGGQFCDRGPSYRPAVFVATPRQRSDAEASKAAAQTALGKPINTPIRNLGAFWPAEGYHQDFYKSNALRYKLYRAGCGRDRRLKALWDR